jgi:hypothetical protein
LQAPLAQHIPLQVVPKQLQPSSGFPEQLIQFGEQTLWHVPLLHDGVEKQVEHFVPQPPQLLTSVWTSMHAPLQRVIPLGQAQVPPEHVRPVGHTVEQLPQLLSSVWRLTQTPLQSVVPLGHAQVPLEQVAPVAHTVEQLPQCFGSLDRFTHAPLQSVRPAAH